MNLALWLAHEFQFYFIQNSAYQIKKHAEVILFDLERSCLTHWRSQRNVCYCKKNHHR